MSMPVKRKRALLGSNPPRNSRVETHSDGPGVDRQTGAPGLTAAKPKYVIGVDLLIPAKTHYTPAPWGRLGGAHVQVLPRRSEGARLAPRSFRSNLVFGRSRGDRGHDGPDYRPPCPCCGGRMIIVASFGPGGGPRAPPSQAGVGTAMP